MLNKLLSISLIIFSFVACSDDKNDFEAYISKVQPERIDTSVVIPRASLLASFDTIPATKGPEIIEKYLLPLPKNSKVRSICLTGYERGFDTVKTILISKKNLRLDPINRFSDSTYFIVMIFGNVNDYGIAAPFYLDFNKREIGIFSFPDTGKVSFFNYPSEALKFKKN